jgi:hypothetical protein
MKKEQQIKYKSRDLNKLYEIRTVKHGWVIAELLKRTKSGRLVLRLLFTNTIVIRKVGKRIRPCQRVNMRKLKHI